MRFRRQSITPLFAAVLVLAACAPSAQQVNNDGNAAFKNQNYDAALNAYQQAQQQDTQFARTLLQRREYLLSPE